MLAKDSFTRFFISCHQKNCFLNCTAKWDSCPLLFCNKKPEVTMRMSMKKLSIMLTKPSRSIKWIMFFGVGVIGKQKCVVDLLVLHYCQWIFFTCLSCSQNDCPFFQLLLGCWFFTKPFSIFIHLDCIFASCESESITFVCMVPTFGLMWDPWLVF